MLVDVGLLVAVKTTILYYSGADFKIESLVTQMDCHHTETVLV